MIKTLTIFGTRPEAIKLAPVIKRLDSFPNEFSSVVCVTAQHRHMLDQVLDVFRITPRYDLNVMKHGQSIEEIIIHVLQDIGEIMSAEGPDLVLVQGDTTTTFAACLVAFYQKIKIGHVEAGLRSFNKYEPFPEEMNRRLTGVIADYHYAPTNRAKENLLREGVDERDIVVTGNTGIDSLFMVLEQLRKLPPENTWLAKSPQALDGRRLILVTAHRRESFGRDFEEICKALVEISRRNPDVIIVYPVHLNPNVRTVTNRLLRGHERIKLVEPLEYVAFVDLMDRASIILTDSGGIQEEAPSLGKPVLVMRNVTERAEAIEVGAARLVGTNAEVIAHEVQKLLDAPLENKEASQPRNPFGDGRASERIAEHILQQLS